MDETDLDLTGLRCPLPVLKAKKAMRTIAPGQVLKIRATDPDSLADFRHFCATTGDEFLEWTKERDVFIYRIRKAG